MQGEDILKTTGLHGTEGPDELRADGCLKAILYGEGGPDRLLGGNGDVELHGGEGDDILAGGQGSDVLAGGPGNDLLAGGPGNDAYVFGPGGGLDLVYACGAGADSLTLFGASPAELRFAREGPHLTLSLAGSGAGAGAAVTVFGFFAEGCGLDRIEAGPLTLPGANIPGLLEALAPIGPPAGADGSWTAGQRQALLPLLEAYWELKSQKVR
jgi:hypothetical protein